MKACFPIRELGYERHSDGHLWGNEVNTVNGETDKLQSLCKMAVDVLYYTFNLYNLLILAEAFRQTTWLTTTSFRGHKLPAHVLRPAYSILNITCFLRFYVLALYTCYHTGRFYYISFSLLVSTDGIEHDTNCILEYIS
jgi:hypothetical protein